jgi:hypothetical protein
VPTELYVVQSIDLQDPHFNDYPQRSMIEPNEPILGEDDRDLSGSDSVTGS